MKKIFFLSFFTAFVFASCGPTTDTTVVDTTPPKPIVKGPAFNGDSAYAFVKTQVDFGPRIPDTEAHTKCYEYFLAKLKSYGLTVKPQLTSGRTAIDGRMVPIMNIFAQFHPERKERILLLAHWDTRVFADDDPDTTLRKKPFDGASDGASGAGVLLELARILQQQDPNIGVDFLFSDTEDGGLNGGESADTWCLGTQYWAQNLEPGYTARYGILLDMVGGKNATFPKEGTGYYFAKNVVDKVWASAARLGYGNVFINREIGQTIDDHLYVNQIARIPTIDIVHYDVQNFGYPSWHHTTKDNMDIIDATTLKTVGEVLVDVIYNEL
ncbi:MAG: M28 family peptidase [Bacteroidota bacterium]|nr:M28 family peptidase [Bacteroidota bacterium]